MKKILFLITIGITVLLTSCNSSKPISAQKEAKMIEIAYKVSNMDFDFIPTSISPMRGRTLQLSGGYSLEVTPDFVRSYIPYIGRAYVLPTNPMTIGLDFKSKDFTTEYIQNTNGSFTVKIKPNDLSNLEDKGMEMTLQISSSGSATLNVNFFNRQSVSYNGYIN